MVSAKWSCLALASWFSVALFAQNPLLDASKLPDGAQDVPGSR
jgi:hypothetical protein